MKLITKTTIFLLFIIIFFLTYLIICFIFLSTPNLLIWEKESLDYKKSIIEDKEKILLLGGSNVLFGVSAEMLENRTGIQTINYATGIGLWDYILYDSKEVLNSGDIVILSLEYEYYFYNPKKVFEPPEQRDKYIFTYDKEYFNQFNYLERVNLVVINGVSLLDAIASRFQKIDVLYPLEDYNTNGDNINYVRWEPFWSLRVISENITFEDKIEFPDNFKDKINNYYGTKTLLEYKDWCEINNITLIITYPTIIYQEEYKESIAQVHKFNINNNFTMIGTPENYYYNYNLFYDTYYHLNNEGKIKRTNFIWKHLNTTLPSIYYGKDIN